MIDEYSFFLFIKLYDAVYGVSEEEYDTLYGKVKSAYLDYDDSEFNDPNKPEYECMVNYLEHNNGDKK
jgi:hypothetical protein